MAASVVAEADGCAAGSAEPADPASSVAPAWIAVAFRAAQRTTGASAAFAEVTERQAGSILELVAVAETESVAAVGSPEIP